MERTTTDATRISKRALFKLLGYEPHEGQRAVHASRARRRVLACGSRWGKSLAAAMEAVAALLEPREAALGWIVAPTRDLVDRTFLRTVDALKSRFAHRIVELDLRSQKIVVRNLGGGLTELRGKSADMPVTLLGEALDFLIVDEAARLKVEIWSSFLSQRLVDRHGWALLLSTPNGCDWFYELYKRGQKGRDAGFESWSSPSSANPHLEQAVIEEERARLPVDVFRQEYEAVFIGADLEPCEVCGGPSPTAKGVVVLFEGDELVHCGTCNEPVNAEGRTLVQRIPGWPACLVVIRCVDDSDGEPVPVGGH